jgi:hypothetical protein
VGVEIGAGDLLDELGVVLGEATLDLVQDLSSWSLSGIVPPAGADLSHDYRNPRRLDGTH